MNNMKDFEIEDGILIKYVGKDTTVVVSEGVLSVSKFAFEDTKVAEIILPSTVETISDVAFHETPDLQKVVVNEDNPTYCSVDGCLYSKDKKRFVRIEQTPFILQKAAKLFLRMHCFKEKLGRLYFRKH